MNILFGGQPVKGSPYTVRVYDAGRVVVSNMPIQSVVGNPVVFDSKCSWTIITCLTLYNTIQTFYDPKKEVVMRGCQGWHFHWPTHLMQVLV